VPFGSVPDKAEKHKYGYITIDATGEAVSVIDRTNPNKKWDWYELGGRWTGKFKLKLDATTGRLGRPGLMTDVGHIGTADQAIKRDIDFDGMRDEAGAKAGVTWDNAHRIIAGREFRSWDALREAHPGNIEAARAEYWAQPAIKDLDAAKLTGFHDDASQFLASREQYVQTARDAACATFAVLKDGTWYERGAMGWWGAVHDEKDRDEWNRQFTALLDSVHDFTLLSIYDCHI
jgi:hypothetical protein